MVARLFDACARAVRHHDFAHHQRAVGARGVRIDGDRLEHAIGVWPSACMVELPSKPHSGSCSSVGKRVEVFELRLAAQIWHRRIAVEPDVLEFIFGHYHLSSADAHLKRCASVRVSLMRAQPPTGARPPPPANFKHLMCQSALGSRCSIGAASMRHRAIRKMLGASLNEQTGNCTYCSHALILCEACRAKFEQGIIL